MTATADRGGVRHGTDYNNDEMVRSEGWGRRHDTIIEIMKVNSG